MKLIKAGLIAIASLGLLTLSYVASYATITSPPERQESIGLETITDERPLEVYFFKFPEMDSLNIPTKKIEIPENLENLINLFSYGTKVSNPERFNQEVLDVARDIGYTIEEISVLEPYQLIGLSADIVGKKLLFRYVDEDPDFIKEHGKNLPIDDYFHIGKGDCDKYADLTIATYNLLKKINLNPKTKNVYLTRDFLDNTPDHFRDLVVIPMLQHHIYLTPIDTTRVDLGGKLGASFVHVNPKYSEFRFFQVMEDYVRSNQIIDSLLVKETDNIKKKKLLSEKKYNLEKLEEQRKWRSLNLIKSLEYIENEYNKKKEK